MRKLISILAALVICLGATAQTYTVDGLIDAATNKRVRLDFTFGEKGASFAMPGSLVINGQRYVLKMMGITTICDGQTTWTKNGFSREVTISAAQPIPPLKSLAKNVTGFQSENGQVSGDFTWGSKVFTVTAYNIAISPAVKDDSTFTLDESSLGEDWIVTDTRQN